MKFLSPLFAGLLTSWVQSHAADGGGSAAGTTAPLDQRRLLACVRQIENAPVEYVSPSGCRGIYQLSRKVWVEWSVEPHRMANESDARSAAITHNVALKQCAWILQSALPALKMPATPYAFALLWLQGFGNVEKLRITDKAVGAAKRFENLYNDRTWHP